MKMRINLLTITGVLLLNACSFGNSTTAAPAQIPAIEVSPTSQPVLTTPMPVVSTEVPPTSVPKPVIKLETRIIEEDQVSPPVHITIEYPYMLEPANDNVFNREIKSLIDDQIAFIKNEAVDVEAWRSKEQPEFSSGLTIKYEVGLIDKGYTSVRMGISPFVAGAAHPNFFFLTVNYDLVHGKLLKLSDLFIPGSFYISKLSTYCKNDLIKQNLQSFFPEGVLPNETNFANWNFSNEGLVILFDPYQVGPWAIGPQKVVVPYSELKSIALPSGPLEDFIK